jgi:PAS domain S-box-containing protein
MDTPRSATLDSIVPLALPAALDVALVRELLDAAPDALVIADPDGRIRLTNRQATALFGYTVAELAGQPVELLLPARVRTAHTQHRDRYAVDPQARAMGAGLELFGQHKDGHEFPVEISLSPVTTTEGPLVMSAVRDITARRQVETALHQAQAAAEHARATAEVAQAAAERANRAKSEFLSRMSHELRTPLNAVLGFGQLLALDPLATQQQQNVGQILKAGHHLLDLINEVLDIARIEAGRLALSLEPVRLVDVMREALDLTRPLAADQRLVLDDAGLADACGAVFVLADRQRLKQVFLNLLSNAIKYNRPDGAVALLCATDAERVRLGVRDTGPGIAPAQLGQLFEPFDRLGAELTEVEGTGLGLALSKGLMAAMHGTVRVESAVGVGSTFWVELPRGTPPLAADDGGAAADAAALRPLVGSRHRTVLYVEDNLPNLALIEQLLARWSDVVLIPAMQGRRGIELATQHHPDLILLDVHLPDIDGSAVLQMLQEDARTRAIPVVVVSADATDRQMRRLLAAGARAYVTKPIDVVHFLRVVGEFLPARQADADEEQRR